MPVCFWKPGICRNAVFVVILFACCGLSLCHPCAEQQNNRRIHAAGGQSRNVAVVNDIPGHFEVLVGVVFLLQKLDVKPTVYLTGTPDAVQSIGVAAWLGNSQHVDWQPLQSANDSSVVQSKPSVLVCISAELAPQVCRSAVLALQPSLLILWVHRADTATPTAKILSLHHAYKLVALAPHVANLAEKRLRKPVAWAMPVAPYEPPTADICMELSCLHGFSIQGSLRKYKSKAASGFTRNYTQLWDRMQQLKGSVEAGGAVVKVAVLGKGLREDLLIPSSIDADVEFLSRLPYQDFWRRIYHSLALVPAFGMPVYYESRISSTILASLVCGVPLIAEQRLLDTYTFLQPQHVFLRLTGEDEVSAMYRVLRLPAAEVFARRQALVTLRQQLNSKAMKLFAPYLEVGEA